MWQHGGGAAGTGLACVSQKTRKLYGPEKPFVKLRPAYSVKLVFLYVVKGIKIKITAKFCDTEHFRFEDTKRIVSPKKFRVFRETGLDLVLRNTSESWSMAAMESTTSVYAATEYDWPFNGRGKSSWKNVLCIIAWLSLHSKHFCAVLGIGESLLTSLFTFFLNSIRLTP